MDDETFALHIELRHQALKRQARATRLSHGQFHRNGPAAWLDHEHREASREALSDGLAVERERFWYSADHP